MKNSSHATKERAAVVIHGPAGCGKTRHAAALAKHYGKAAVIDDWSSLSDIQLPPTALAMTNESPAPDGAIPFADALQAAGLTRRP